MSSIRFGCFLPMVNPRIDVEAAIKAEKNGFDSVWLGDHMSTQWSYLQKETSELLVTLGLIAKETEKIMISPAVTDPYRRHPAILAQAVATLDRFKNGRAALGIGAGKAVNITPFCIPWTKPVTGLRDAIAIVKMALDCDSGQAS